MTYNVVGKPLGRVEGPAKVTGKATSSANILLPGMIWEKVLRSSLPHACHACIVRIETTVKVAVMATEDPTLAEDAWFRIEVEDEELPAVFDAQEAMEPVAPVPHPHYRPYPYAPSKYFSDIPNIHSHVTWAPGDAEQGFAAAVRGFEPTFATHRSVTTWRAALGGR